MKQFLLVLPLLGILFSAQGCTSSDPRSFATPQDAVTALVDAARAHSTDRLKEILGDTSGEMLDSGDSVADRNGVDDFVARYDEKHQLTAEADGSMSLVVGANEWPLPIPLVKSGSGKWSFDTERGMDEIINRRIGRNELYTIQVCLAVVDAQREYAVRDPNNTGAPEYALRFLSSEGKKDGLYWTTADGEPLSPMGELIALASAEGYKKSETGEPQPYHGYYFRMLEAQGPHATGGARDYIVNGKLLGGFGVIAYPAEYGNSGVMSFIVNHEGILYQRDLGESTETVAKSMTAFDPAPEWVKVDPPPATEVK